MEKRGYQKHNKKGTVETRHTRGSRKPKFSNSLNAKFFEWTIIATQGNQPKTRAKTKLERNQSKMKTRVIFCLKRVLEIPTP